jgi:hypothetical protein
MRSKPDIGAGVAEHDPTEELKAENARLVALLEANGIQWRAETEHVLASSMPERSRFSLRLVHLRTLTPGMESSAIDGDRY